MNERTDKLNSVLLKIGSIVAGLALWHILSDYILEDPTFLVSPVVVVRASYEMLFVTGELYPHLFASSWIFFMVSPGSSRVCPAFDGAQSRGAGLRPWTTLYGTPRIAFAPILLLWFGIGGGAKVAIVFLGCLFPILINSYYGMRVVNREYVELARSFRLTSRALFMKILLPASVPFILAGIRLSIGRGLTSVAIAEWFAPPRDRLFGLSPAKL
jgi:ABC-type nitrate/sulfonate/bicarbonate transport system permease component